MTNFSFAVAGLQTELEIHALLLKRIRHQFRRSKFVQRSLSIQSCARRLRVSNPSKFRSLISKTEPFEVSMVALLDGILSREVLMRQMSTYAELVAQASSQAMAQEHYFFFGTDLSMLATSSRIWVSSRSSAEDLRYTSHKISEALRQAGVKVRSDGAPLSCPAGVLDTKLDVTEEYNPSQNSCRENSTTLRNGQQQNFSKNKVRVKKKATSGALDRFAVA